MKSHFCVVSLVWFVWGGFLKLYSKRHLFVNSNPLSAKHAWTSAPILDCWGHQENYVWQKVYSKRGGAAAVMFVFSSFQYDTGPLPNPKRGLEHIGMHSYSRDQEKNDQLIGPLEISVRFWNTIFNLVLLTVFFRSSPGDATGRMPHEPTDDKRTLFQVMPWCRQATSHYMSQCWSRFMLPYGVTSPQYVDSKLYIHGKYWI